MPRRNSRCQRFVLAQYCFVFTLSVVSVCYQGSYESCLASLSLVMSATLRTLLASSPRRLPHLSPALDCSSVPSLHCSVCKYTRWTCARGPHTQDVPQGAHAPSKCQTGSPAVSPPLPPSESSQSHCAQGLLSALRTATAPPSSSGSHHCAPSPVILILPFPTFLLNCCLFLMGPFLRASPVLLAVLKAQALELMTWFQSCLCHSWL